MESSEGGFVKGSGGSFGDESISIYGSVLGVMHEDSVTLSTNVDAPGALVSNSVPSFAFDQVSVFSHGIESVGDVGGTMRANLDDNDGENYCAAGNKVWVDNPEAGKAFAFDFGLRFLRSLHSKHHFRGDDGLLPSGVPVPP